MVSQFENIDEDQLSPQFVKQYNFNFRLGEFLEKLVPHVLRGFPFLFYDEFLRSVLQSPFETATWITI